MRTEAHGPIHVKTGEILALVPNVEAFRMGHFAVEGLVRDLMGVLALGQEFTLGPYVFLVDLCCHESLRVAQVVADGAVVIESGGQNLRARLRNWGAARHQRRLSGCRVLQGGVVVADLWPGEMPAIYAFCKKFGFRRNNLGRKRLYVCGYVDFG